MATETKNSSIASATDVVQVYKMRESATLPKRGSLLAAGYDLCAAADCEIPARGQAIVKTGLMFSIPAGQYGKIHSRSGLAAKHCIEVGAGVIDADYRGEVGILLKNSSDVAFSVRCGDRCAQIIFEKHEAPAIVQSEVPLNDTERGAGGFGSTGMR